MNLHCLSSGELNTNFVMHSWMNFWMFLLMFTSPLWNFLKELIFSHLSPRL